MPITAPRIGFSEAERPSVWEHLLLRFSNLLNRNSAGEFHNGVLILVDSSLTAGVAPEVLQTLRSALDVIDRHHPTCWRAFRRYVRFVRLMAVGFDGAWGPLERCIVLNPSFVQRASPLTVAYMLVHEVAHARIWWAGIPYSRERAGRIEAGATRRMVRFAARMGASDEELRRLGATAYDPSDAFIIQKGKEAVLAGEEPTWLDHVMSRWHLWMVRHSRKR